MDKIRIKENYENYERVKNAFKAFVHALVWESMDIDNGVHEDEVNTHIERYCKANGDGLIHDFNRHITKYIKSLELRYSVHCYELDANGEVESANHLETNNVVVALRKAAEFYRSAKRPKVRVYDNETDKYIAEWD